MQNMVIQRHRRHVCIVFLQNLSIEIFKLPNCFSHGWLTLGVWGYIPPEIARGGPDFLGDLLNTNQAKCLLSIKEITKYSGL